MESTLFWTSFGITHAILSWYLIDNYSKLLNIRFSNMFRYSLFTFFTVGGFVRGYTGTDLISNIKTLINYCV